MILVAVEVAAVGACLEIVEAGLEIPRWEWEWWTAETAARCAGLAYLLGTEARGVVCTAEVDGSKSQWVEIFCSHLFLLSEKLKVTLMSVRLKSHFAHWGMQWSVYDQRDFAFLAGISRSHVRIIKKIVNWSLLKKSVVGLYVRLCSYAVLWRQLRVTWIVRWNEYIVTCLHLGSNGTEVMRLDGMVNVYFWSV